MRLRKKPWIEEAMKEVQGEYVFLHDIDKFKGHWQEMFPGKRLCLEIGCGKGRFTIGMAELYPDKAFIGIETQHDIAYSLSEALLYHEAFHTVRIEEYHFLDSVYLIW